MFESSVNQNRLVVVRMIVHAMNLLFRVLEYEYSGVPVYYGNGGWRQLMFDALVPESQIVRTAIFGYR
jgi:hypothetical protein